MAARLGTKPEYLMAVMSFETGGSFSPAQANNAGSGATGLIQFMPNTAAGLGTRTAAFAQMSSVEQLQYVAQYLDRKSVREGQSVSVRVDLGGRRSINKKKNTATHEMITH